MAWILYIGNARQALYQVGPGGTRLLWEGEGAPDAPSPVWRRVRRIRVLLDLIEEEFRLEKLPHLRGRDRWMLVERKRRQLFREIELVAATHLGRESEGRQGGVTTGSCSPPSAPRRCWNRGGER